MHRNQPNPRRCLSPIGFLWFFLVFLTGCAGTAQVKPIPVAPETASSAAAGWWYARFRMVWPENTDPDWSVDTLIADQVISPVLQRYRHQIELWRFHRRAARDQAGHRFSFIFYASPEAAKSIYQAIDRNSLIDQLKRDQKIERVSYDSTDQIRRPKHQDTSDKNWPIVIQQSWPHFIQGASQMWLQLIQALTPEMEQKYSDSVYAQYKGVQGRLNELWKNEGQHVFLHHLNALYAYQPLIIIERKMTRF